MAHAGVGWCRIYRSQPLPIWTFFSFSTLSRQHRNKRFVRACRQRNYIRFSFFGLLHSFPIPSPNKFPRTPLSESACPCERTTMTVVKLSRDRGSSSVFRWFFVFWFFLDGKQHFNKRYEFILQSFFFFSRWRRSRDTNDKFLPNRRDFSPVVFWYSPLWTNGIQIARIMRGKIARSVYCCNTFLNRRTATILYSRFCTIFLSVSSNDLQQY